ncbi:baseplate J-like family protein [Rhodococcus sp. MTM3W5.2]|uniref:baseplate J/gp47 family protein n=1 Tax=Rhodococcus sp. MTM3W5.2 TaxID=1805827 RepID=UPI0009792C60|nr:baseplate J/gp47 family protein [Rhodococcus sp. MTM3W5.2]AQA24832.1 baseplate J-like family protein [Rhodococcus sp. MTM3W5.2]
MARDYDSLLRAMLTLVPDKLPEWTEYTAEADFGNVLLQLFAHMGDILSYYQDRVANESFLGSAQTRRSVIDHLNLIGYRMATAVPAAARLTVTVPTASTGVVTINRGAAVGTASQPGRPSVRFEYNGTEALPIDLDTLPTDPADATRKIYVEGIPVEQGRLVPDEVVGVSDGSPGQRFPLLRAGIILRSLGPTQAASPDIVVQTELGGEPWSPQRSLAFSRGSQRDFVVDIDEDDRATLRFGDGRVTGAIPPLGSTIRVTYRVGGGALGNVAANTIRTVVDAPALATIGARVFNPAPATGGAERESIEHAVDNAPTVFRSLGRAVTVEDYRALALSVNGVGKVRASADRRNVITLFVAPAEGGQVSDVLAAALLAYFADKRAITTVVEIADVDYVPVWVTATVGVDSFYAQSAVAAAIRTVAGGLLAFPSVDFGQHLYLSKVYEAIESVPGVAYTTVTEFRLDGMAPGAVEPTGKLSLGPNEIPVVPAAVDYRGGIKLIMEGGY